MNQRLLNQAAFQMATELMGMVGHCFREEEYRDVFECFYEACKCGLECYEIEAGRMRERLKPSMN